MKAFIEAQFGYCPLEWMRCNRSCNNYKNLHERALRIVYNDRASLFQDLLQRDQSVSIHHRNICLLGRELYEARNIISRHIMNELFEERNILYNLRSHTDFTTGPICNVNNGLKSLKYLGPKLWNIIPPDIRNSGNTEEFAKKSVGFLKIVLISYVLITSITLGMSVRYIFGARRSNVLWQIERVPILTGYFTMAASALKCYS